MVFRTLLFKFFNKIETWELLENVLGAVTLCDYTFDRYDDVLAKAMKRGESIYSAAYIMPSAGTLGHKEKHRNHLTLLERMIADELPKRLAGAGSMQRAFDLILSYPSIGDFLAYQYVTDVNYSRVTDFTETEFVVPGPGALDGIRKCFADTGGLNTAEVIRFMADRQELEFERLGIKFQDLWGRRLQLIDCQNLFCEVDKYARVRHPDVEGVSGRTKIKQKFRPCATALDYWYPPKWSINETIAAERKTRDSSANDLTTRETPMNFNTYQERAKATARTGPSEDKGLMIALLGLSGEVGQLQSEYKKHLRDGDCHTLFRDRFVEEMGDVLWYLSDVATKFGFTLEEIAERNLAKCEQRWGPLPIRPPFDEGYPDNERFPRRFLIDFATTHDQNERPVLRVFYKGEPFGDALTDNSDVADGYAFHDAIHLSFTAVLGWSPLTRKLLNAKRKSNPKVDENQDGARALYTEEGLSTFIFAYARNYNWLEGKSSVGSEILRVIRSMTANLEVGCCTEGEWERAIVQGFAVWRAIKKRGSGTLIMNLDERSITVKDK